MRKGWLLVAALAAMILAAPTAWAQRGGGRGGFGGGAMLLGQKSVQTELKLSDEQTAKVTEHLEKQRGAFAELRDLDRAERAAKMRERATANEAALKEILAADQLKRLKQITLQQRGASPWPMTRWPTRWASQPIKKKKCSRSTARCAACSKVAAAKIARRCARNSKRRGLRPIPSSKRYSLPSNRPSGRN